MSQNSPGLAVRAATEDDLPLIGSLCARSSSIPQEGIGYPRCDSETELIAELTLYDGRLDTHVVVVCAGDDPIGFGGFLVPDEDDEPTYLFGPMLVPQWRSEPVMTEALALLVAQPLAAGPLRTYIEDANEVLTKALLDTGWHSESVSLEMVYDIGPAAEPTPDRYPVRTLAGAEDPRFAEVAELVGRQHGWSTDRETRLRDSIADGYEVVLCEDGDQLAGCALWMGVDDTDFARLDYVSVTEAYAGRGYGTTLVEHVLAKVRRLPDLHQVFLSLDPANAAAHRLYLKCGFRDTVQSRKYVLSRCVPTAT